MHTDILYTGGLLCGRSLRDVISSGNSIYVKFFSNGPNRRRSGSGFSADYKSGSSIHPQCDTLL